MKPVRIRLYGHDGFDLQAASRAINGLKAVNCAWPGKWGNIFKIGLIACNCRSAGECYHNIFRVETTAEAVEEHWLMPRSPKRLAQIKSELGGKNLACWCALDEPCHVNNLLRLANE